MLSKWLSETWKGKVIKKVWNGYMIVSSAADIFSVTYPILYHKSLPSKVYQGAQSAGVFVTQSSCTHSPPQHTSTRRIIWQVIIFAPPLANKHKSGCGAARPSVKTPCWLKNNFWCENIDEGFKGATKHSGATTRWWLVNVRSQWGHAMCEVRCVISGFDGKFHMLTLN